VTDRSRDVPPPPRPSLKSRYRSATLRGRLAIVFVVGGVVTALLVAVCTASFVRVLDARHLILNQLDPASLQADQLLVAYLNQETGVRGYALSGNGIYLQPYTEAAMDLPVLEKQLTASLAGQPRLLELLQQVKQQASDWQRQFAEPVVAAVARGETAYDTPQVEQVGKTLFDTLRVRFDSLDQALNAGRTSSGNELTTATDQLVAALIIALVLLVGSGVLLSRALRRWVTDPLLRLGDDANAVTRGELSHVIAPTGPPEISRLAVDVEAMRERIVDELGRLAEKQEDLDERNRDLVRSNVELEQFAYVASHDLQEPLRKVTSFVQLLQQRYGGELDERADQYIEFAVDGAKRMQTLVNDLLTFSRVGRTTERFVPVDLEACAETAIGSLGPAILESDAHIEVGQLPSVMGDATLLSSLLQNLIGNSIKFRGPATPDIRLAAVRQEADWLVTVADNGIGIEPRFADRIFVIFQRLHGRDSYEGTGIGLALGKKIVEFHGGVIWIDTEYQGGTKVCFTLPIVANQGAQ
jgi:signal transduction histidine kinase